MKTSCILLMLMFGMSAVACAQVAPMPSHELTVPNFDDASPACVVKVPDVNSQCTPEGCTLPAPVGSTLDSIKLDFSCVPSSAPTGFENPAPDVKVQSLRSKNASGDISLTDDVYSPPNERFRHLYFCLYGKLNTFCGFAKVMRLEDRTKVDGTRTVKAFLQGIELQEPWTKNGR